HRQLVSAIRNATTPGKVAFVWSPNIAYGADDYSKWYPGDEYVDWAGLSVYWKGSYDHYPWISNTVADPGFFNFALELEDFYRTYSVQKGFPFVMSEGTAAYHLNYSSDGGATFQPCGGDLNRTEIVMSWWNSFLFDSSFFELYPRVKMFNLFEFLKEEDDMGTKIWRDFRTTVDVETRGAFSAALKAADAQGADDNGGRRDGEAFRDEPGRPICNSLGVGGGDHATSLWDDNNIGRC
ncbi:hypothetical protein HK101_003300, partial [Irineochytrium annulatum]